jgi:hypothetical protein
MPTSDPVPGDDEISNNELKGSNGGVRDKVIVEKKGRK